MYLFSVCSPISFIIPFILIKDLINIIHVSLNSVSCCV